MSARGRGELRNLQTGAPSLTLSSSLVLPLRLQAGGLKPRRPRTCFDWVVCTEQTTWRCHGSIRSEFSLLSQSTRQIWRRQVWVLPGGHPGSGGRGRAARRWGTFIHQTALRMPDPGTWAPGCHGLLAQCPVSCWPGPWVPALGCGKEPGLRPFLSEWLPWAPGSAGGVVGSRPPDVHVAGREGDRCGKGVTLGGHALIPRSWLLQNMPGLRSGFLQARCPQKTGVLSSGCSVG